MFDTCSFKPTNDGFPPSSGGGGGAVTSVFGRTGVVIAVAGDYTSSEITNSSTVTGTYVTDALNWLDTNKLGTSLTSANIIVGNGSNVATAVAMSGDIGISNTGATTIQNDAVTTNKILNSNVTYAKIQDVSTNNRLLGRATAGSGVLEEITLGTNLSFTGTTLNAAGGGTSYNVQSQTLSGNVVWDSTNFTPNNVQYLVTNNATTRILTINNTGFVAGSLIRVIVGSLSPGNITIVIGGMTFTQSRVSGIEALFDGTNWLLNPLIGGTNTGIAGSEQSFVVGYSANVPASSYAVAVGFNMNSSGTRSTTLGANVTNSQQDSVVIGQGASSTAINSVIIGQNASGSAAAQTIIGRSSSGSGTNQTLYGQGISAGSNTGVVAIGQGITTTNTDAVVIGRAASGGGTSNVTIGSSSTSSGGNQSTIIGSSSNGAGTNNVCIVGNNITISNVADLSVTIGSRGTSTKAYQFAKGAYAYPRHYGAESRRIDTNTSTSDATNPSRHDEKDAWNGTTTNNAITELFLFGVSNERLTLQDNEILTATVQVQAKRNATTDCFVDTAFVSIVRGVGAGTVTLVLAPSSINTGFLGTGSTVTYTLDADTTNGSLRFRATGNTGETWQWTANIITYTRTRTA